MMPTAIEKFLETGATGTSQTAMKRFLVTHPEKDAPQRLGLISQFKRAYNMGDEHLQFDFGADWVATVIRQADPDERKQLLSGLGQERMKLMGRYAEPTAPEAGFVKRTLLSTAQMAPFMLKTWWGGVETGAPTALAAGGVAVLAGQAGPQALLPEEAITGPVAAYLGYRVGRVIGSFQPAQRQGRGELFVELLDAGVNPVLASYVSLVGSYPYAAIETVQVAAIFPGEERLLDPAKFPIKQALKRRILRWGLDYAKAVAGEIAEEGLQRINNEFFTDVGRVIDKIPVGPLRTRVREYFEGAFEEMKEVAGPMALMLAPGHARGIAREQLARGAIERIAAMRESAEVPPPAPEAAVEAPRPAEAALAPEVAEVPPVRWWHRADRVEMIARYWERVDRVSGRAEVDGRIQQEQLLAVAKGDLAKAKELDRAMAVYIDLRNAEERGHGTPQEQIERYKEKSTPEQRRIRRLSQNLPQAVKDMAHRIMAANREAGAEAMDADVIRNAFDNYTMRLWKQPTGRELAEIRRKFGAQTGRARQRTLESILHGESRGKELAIRGAIGASVAMRKELAKAIASKAMLKEGIAVGVFSEEKAPEEGMVPVEHPNFSKWEFVGKAEEGKVYTRDLYLDENGTLFQRRPLYAREDIAKKLNAMLGTTKLSGPTAHFLTKWNAIIKSTILTTTLFHHQAFLRSFFLGGNLDFESTMHAYEYGKQALLQFGPEISLLIEQSLTFGLIQDWESEMLQEKTLLGEFLDKIPGIAQGKQKILDLREANTRFLFGSLGPYLKAGAALLEYRHQVKKQQTALEAGTTTHKQIAREVANLINDDFGGLHLGRLGRDPTRQHFFRLLALAPDWTESNIRSMVKAIAGGSAAERAMYRQFWGRIAYKGLGATVALNLLISGFDDDDFWERYRKAWQAGRFRWLDVDITPLARALGAEKNRRHYFSILGHFKDPLKFIVQSPIKTAKTKGSVLSRMATDAITAQDWQGKQFTTVAELLGMDEGGKGVGKLTKWTFPARGPISWSQTPSFAAYEMRSSMPVQAQNLAALIAGEMDAFTAVTRSLGLSISRSAPQEEEYRIP